ncbi:MAG: hypothetical protein CVU47_00410 [Chloroflexi bacterium HGW-Chloroflexi-9]|nr:MAG: hypothetical protein CVU47_00410 [Chloroflexi bacterium HGW-Chloroflexi-9]
MKHTTTIPGAPPTLRHFRAALIALAVGTWLLVACGGEATPSASDGATAGTTPATAPAATASAPASSGTTDGEFGSTLYVGGAFRSTSAGRNYVARWDSLVEESLMPGEWNTLAGGLTGNMTLSAVAMTLGPDGDLYVAGGFEAAGGVPAASIARWDGEGWHPVGDGLQVAPGSALQSIVFDGSGALWAGGTFQVDPGAPNPWGGLARYLHDEGWTYVVDGPLAGVHALAAVGDRLFVAGALTMDQRVDENAVWQRDSQAWTNLGAVTHTVLTGTAVDAMLLDARGDLVIGGTFTHVDGVEVNGLARWDGNNWTAVGNGVHGFVTTLALDAAGNLIVGGGFNEVGGPLPVGDVTRVEARNIARWDGDSWSALGEGVRGVVASVAVDNAGQIYAGADITTVAVWDGSAWGDLPSLASGGSVRVVFVAP